MVPGHYTSPAAYGYPWYAEPRYTTSKPQVTYNYPGLSYRQQMTEKREYVAPWSSENQRCYRQVRVNNGYEVGVRATRVACP